MILAVDVGNSHIVLGGMEAGEVLFSARLATDKTKTADDYAAVLHSLLAVQKQSLQQFTGAILSTVVPVLSQPLQQAIEQVLEVEPLVVNSQMQLDMPILMDYPDSVGSDLLVDAVAAKAEYPLPLLIFDMGTATTVTAIDASGAFCGGMILAGAALSISALAEGTAQLPQVALTPPPTMLGKNTIHCMQSGVIYGNAAMVDGVIQRARELLGEDLTVVATGGIAPQIIPHCTEWVQLDTNLTLKGLWILWNKNQGETTAC